MPLPNLAITSGSTNNIKVAQGSSLQLTLTVYDPNTGALEDITGSSFVLTVKARDSLTGLPTGADAFTVTGSISGAPANGLVTFAITAAKTTSQIPAVYVYDIFQTDASSNKIQVVLPSRFEITSSVYP